MTATRLALWWVDLYTRGVPARVRAERRAEIASDLWEHGAADGGGTRVALAALSRCARGVPADLSWRRSLRRSRGLGSPRAAARAAGWSLAALAYLFLVGSHGYNSTALAGLDLYGFDGEPGDVTRYASISAALLALLLAGGILLRCLPRLAATLLAAATLLMCVAFWWAAPVYGPAGLTVVAAAVVLARRRGQMVSSAAS